MDLYFSISRGLLVGASFAMDGWMDGCVYRFMGLDSMSLDGSRLTSAHLRCD